MACLTDPISPHGTVDRSNQHTWHASQTQSTHMAYLTDSINLHDMFDRSNQHKWHAWQIQSANLFNIRFRPSMVFPL